MKSKTNKAIIGTYFDTYNQAYKFILNRNRKWHRNIKFVILESDEGFIIVNRKYL